MSIATSARTRRRRAKRRVTRKFDQYGRVNRRAGMAALEVVMTTVITMLIASFATYWTMRLSRVVFSVIGEMVGSPLM